MTSLWGRCPLILATCGGLLAVPVISMANVALEEIIVTANKRESSLMQTPASVSAFDSSTRELLGIENNLDLQARTPSLTITSFRVSIRGVGRPNLAIGSEPGVGVYWDGVYNTENGVFNYSRYLDIDRIEVLRGPQGTLYGRNSIGGAVNFISKLPTAEWSGKVGGELSNYDGTVGQALVSGPVTDKLGVLAAVSHIKRDGFQDNTYNGEDYEQDDTRYATFSLQHQTTERWNTVLKVLGSDRDYRPSNGYILEPFSRELNQMVLDETGQFLGFPGMFPAQNFVNMRQGLAVENPALRNVDKVKQDFSPKLENDRWATFLNSEYAADTYTLKYTGSFSKYTFDTITDADASVASDSGVDWTRLMFAGVPVSTITGFEVTPSDMNYVVNQEANFDSHELQYISNWDSDLEFIAGLYYYHSDEEQEVSFREWNDDLMATYAFFAASIDKPVSANNYLYLGKGHVDSTSYATFGQLHWNWTEQTMLTAGLRYSYDEKKGQDNTFVQFVGDPDNPTVYRQEDDDWDKFTWRLGIDHFLSDEHFLYAFAATGYRSGGFNFLKPTASTDVDVVGPEELLSYEVGYKGALLDQRLNVSVAAYYYDYQDLQVIKQDVVSGIRLNTFVNADQATAMGLELEVQALPTESILVSGTYSDNDTEYDDFSTKDANLCQIGPVSQGMSLDPLCQEEQDLSGNQFPLTPEHKASLNLTYFWELFELDWSATTSYMYTSKQWSQPFNVDELDRIDSWDRWDARLTAATVGAAWKATAFVRNIADDRDVLTRGRPDPVTQNSQSALSQPRTYGLQLEYNF